MMAHAAEFFTLDEVNRLKIIQDVIDRRLTTQMAANRLGMTNRRRGKSSNNLYLFRS